MHAVWNFIKSNSRFFVALLFLLITAYVSVNFLKPVFHRADDFGIISVASGLYGSPDEHVLFSHVYFGIILKYFYSHFPEFSAYELLLTFSTTFSLAFLILIFHKKFNGAMFMFLSFLIVLHTGIFFLTNIHFSFAACMPASVAFLLTYQFAGVSGKKKFLLIFISVLMCVFISVLIRPEVFYMTLFIFSPLFFIRSLSLRKNTILLKRYLVILSGIWILSVLLFWGNKSYYEKSNEWKSFIEYYNLRASFTDYVVPYQSDAAQKPGWSVNDYNMAVNWFFADTSVYSKNKLENYVSAIPSTFHRKTNRISKMIFAEKKLQRDYVLKPENEVKSFVQAKILPKKIQTVAPSPDYFGNYVRSILSGARIFFYFILFTFFIIKWDRAATISLISTYVFVFFLFVFIFLFLKPPPPRIVYTILTALIFLNLMFINTEFLTSFSKNIPDLIKYVLMFIIVGQVLNWQIILYKNREAVEAKQYKMFNYFSAICQKFPESKFVVWSPGFSAASMFGPFGIKPNDKILMTNLIHIGAYYGSPFYNMYSKNSGIENLSEDICSNKKLLLIATPELVNMYANFMNEHYQLHVADSLLDKGLGLYKLSVN